MYIDIHNLFNEINQMSARLKNTKSLDEEILIYNSLIYLCETFYLLTDYDIIYTNLAPNNPYRKIIKSRFNNLNFDNIKNSYYLKAAKNILKIYRDTNFEIINYDKNNIIQISDGIDYIYNFFNEYNPKYYKLIKILINNKQVALKPIYDNYKGICYNIPVLKKSYIIFDIKNVTIYDLSGLVHEFGHAIHFNEIDNYTQPKATNHFNEVPAMYFMKLFLDYSSENNLCNNETIKANNLFFRDLLKYFVGVRYCTDFIFPKIDSNHKLLPKDIILSLFQIESTNINLDKKTNLNYAYGSLIALYFANQYHNDPSETKKDFINYINQIGNINNKEMLNICGLNQKELANPKVLKKELKNHMLNKSLSK